jgi:hypothetical protein
VTASRSCSTRPARRTGVSPKAKSYSFSNSGQRPHSMKFLVPIHDGLGLVGSWCGRLRGSPNGMAAGHLSWGLEYCSRAGSLSKMWR